MPRFALPVLALTVVLAGCASYTTPGAAARLDTLALPPAAIEKALAATPSARFPARIATARIQAVGYHTRAHADTGGDFSVVAARDVETDDALARLQGLPRVAGVAPLGRILLPAHAGSLAELRLAAARLKCDVLLVYTFDTVVQAGEQRFAPLNVVALGLLRNKPLTVTTTAAAAIIDVRSEYYYGIAESTTTRTSRARVWDSAAVVDDLRVDTETQAFFGLVTELAATWSEVVAIYDGP